MRQEFIKLWSCWWQGQGNSEELTIAFEQELDKIIRLEVDEAISSMPEQHEPSDLEQELTKQIYGHP